MKKLILCTLVLCILVATIQPAVAACARPTTENCYASYVSPYVVTQGRFVSGRCYDTRHQFATYVAAWRPIRKNQAMLISGCLNGNVIYNARWLR